MNDTALRAESQSATSHKESVTYGAHPYDITHMVFKDDKHEKFYYEKLGQVRYQGWQTSGSVRVVRLAFNLYTDRTPGVDEYKCKDEQVRECKDTKEEETEALDEPSPDDMEEKRSPALAYGVLVLIFGAAAGGIYFFRTYRKEGEDFIDDDDEEDEEEIYEKEEEENDGSGGDTGENEDMDGDDDCFYGEDE